MGRWESGKVGKWEGGKVGRWESGKVGISFTLNHNPNLNLNKKRLVSRGSDTLVALVVRLGEEPRGGNGGKVGRWEGVDVGKFESWKV